MTSLSSGGFTNRTNKTEALIAAIESHVLTQDRYFSLPTGIEHRFGAQATKIHNLLYRSLGPTTDLLRYFPDSLYFDRLHLWPTWDVGRTNPERLSQSADEDMKGLFTFFVEYKYSDSERKRPLDNVPTQYIGIIEREAWLTYQRLTNPNPNIGIYLDGQRTRIALFYAATYAPDQLYAGWEHQIEPIDDPNAIRGDIAQPNARTVGYSTGSGTPWINFDIRRLKPLPGFLVEELFWDKTDAVKAATNAAQALFAPSATSGNRTTRT